MKTKKQRKKQTVQRMKRWIRDGRPKRLISGFSAELLAQFPHWEAPR